MTNYILHTFENHIATITLNRPEKRNALNGEMITQLREALTTYVKDGNCRVLMLKSAGEYFCAGGDIAWMQEMAKLDFNENKKDAENLAYLLYELYSFPKPTIAVVQGAAMGGGLGLVSACDIAIASADTKFATPEVKLGITPSIISPYVMNAIGSRKTQYYCYTGEIFNAEEALGMGLLQKVVFVNELLRAGNTIAESIAANSPHAVSAGKKLMQINKDMTISEILATKMAEHLAEMRESREAKIGLQAFLEKRTPIWQ